jgi:diguanylate cyclase (GGDEF)-like protein
MSNISILIIDDEPDNFDVIETFLSDQDYHLHYAANGQDAINSLETIQPNLILLDLMMPGMDGLEVCRYIKWYPRWQAIPIIMITALSSKQTLAQCLEMGADDFISKPVNRIELLARVRSMLRIHQQYQQLSNFNNQLEKLVQERTEQLEMMLLQDSLTQLPSRTALLQNLAIALQPENPPVGLVYLDCDRFKLVNGAFGYQLGNQLLQVIAIRLQSYVRPGDLLARVGEDEFCFLITNFLEISIVEDWINSILTGFNQPFNVADCQIFLSVSLGIAQANPNISQPEHLLQAADIAMYKAKLRGKGCYEIFDQRLHQANVERLKLENDLQRAVEADEFINYYQPIINLQTQKIVGFEALVRWEHPERGIVSPQDFIPCLEETGLLMKVGMQILRKACQQLFIWNQHNDAKLNMSVNISVRQFASPTLLMDIDQIITDTKINPANLKLEITESTLMENADVAIYLMGELRKRKIQIIIDDFGTGYSSLSYLHRFPIDFLKIDRSFVSQINTENFNYQVVKTIITLSNQLHLQVIAEGIETFEQWEWLKQLDCEFGQGYLFSRPLSPKWIEDIFLKGETQLQFQQER